MMDDLTAAWSARSLPQNLFGGANRYTPSPLSRRRYSSGVCLKGGCLGARPAWSAPPSPCARGSAARAGRLRLLLRLLRVRAPPPSRTSPRLAGAGGFQLGFAPLALRLSWARAMRPPLGSACGRSLLPCLVLGASRPALCAGYAPSRLGLSLSRRCAPPGLGRKPPCAFVLRCCPARCRGQPLRGHAAPAAKLHRKATKLHQKASKSPLFVRHIAASVPECVNGQYAEKPRFRGFSGSH